MRKCWCYQCRRSSPVVVSAVASYFIARTTPLYYSLTLRGGNYSHNSSKKSIGDRYEKFGQFCRAVNEDRHDNADPAFTIRSATREAVVDEADSSSDSDDGIGQDHF